MGGVGPCGRMNEGPRLFLLRKVPDSIWGDRHLGRGLTYIVSVFSMSTDPDSRTGFGPYLQGVGPVYEDGGVQKTIRYGVIEDLERAFELHGQYVAAFLVEPIQGEAGYVRFKLN
jgi:acetylornithine/succinyldiaminopimelate/putrescine aminotransferase